MRDGERKQIISVRLGSGDVERIKTIARRLKVREADVYRFTIRATLARLSPLDDCACTGRDLMPLFAEYGEDLASYFDLDKRRLQEVINAGADLTDNAVDEDDITLLALAGMPDSYNNKRLIEKLRRHMDPEARAASLRDYLFMKYIKARDPSTEPVD